MTSRGTIVVDGVEAIPGPVQQPHIPVRFGTARTTGKPIDRAARYDGVFPLGADVACIARVADAVEHARGNREGFDIAVAVRPGDDLDKLGAAGATWAMQAFWPGHRREQVLRVIDRGNG